MGGGKRLTLEQILKWNLERVKVKILRHEIIKSSRKNEDHIKDSECEGFPSVDIKLKLGSKAQGKNEAWSKQEGFQMNSYQLTLSLHQEESKTTLE